MNFKGFLLLAVILFCSVYVSFHGVLQHIGREYPELRQEITQAVKKDDDSAITLTPILGTEDTETPDNSSANTDTSGGSVTAGNSGQAVGKIIEKFISPYGANTVYNNVYLKNNTDAKIDLKALLSKQLSFKIEKNGEPQVLIMHTHTTESYMNDDRDYYTEQDESRSRESDKNMVAIGNVIEQKLIDAGIGVIHDTTVHDYPSYSGSYGRSATTVSSALKAYPSIKIVIDVHRDAISGDGTDKIKPVVEINGQKSAQVMLVMGSQTGSITDYPNWQENLSLAVKFQQTMEVMYPGLARAVTLNEAKYNQNLSVGSILLEVGSNSNTLDEAKNGAAAAGDAMESLLNTLK